MVAARCRCRFSIRCSSVSTCADDVLGLDLGAELGQPLLQPLERARLSVDPGLEVLDRDVCADDRAERAELLHRVLDPRPRHLEHEVGLTVLALRIDVDRVRVPAQRSRDLQRLVRRLRDRGRVLEPERQRREVPLRVGAARRGDAARYAGERLALCGLRRSGRRQAEVCPAARGGTRVLQRVGGGGPVRALATGLACGPRLVAAARDERRRDDGQRQGREGEHEAAPPGQPLARGGRSRGDWRR